MIRVLITGCSMHSYDLIRALKDNYDGEEIYVVGINCDDTALLRKGVDAGYVVPRITEESYIPTVIDICEKEKVDVILPFITAELPIMAENRELLESHGVKVSISSMESILASGNKVELAKHYPDLMPKQMICKKPLDFFQFADEIGYPKKPMCCKLPNRCGGLGFCIIDEEKGRDLTIYNKFGMNRYITFDMLLELANQILSAFGKSPLPIESSTVEQLVTTGITTVTALINWWYNNSFTQAAMEADKTYDRMKQNGF